MFPEVLGHDGNRGFRIIPKAKPFVEWIATDGRGREALFGQADFLIDSSACLTCESTVPNLY